MKLRFVTQAVQCLVLGFQIAAQFAFILGDKIACGAEGRYVRARCLQRNRVGRVPLTRRVGTCIHFCRCV